MRNLSKDAIKKLRAVKAAILAEPKMYSQLQPPNWAFGRGGCGAPCCFLGWVAWLDNPDPKEYAKIVSRLTVSDFVRYLGVNQVQAGLLFSTYYWNHGVQISIEDAIIGAARIEHFIATDGRE